MKPPAGIAHHRGNLKAHRDSTARPGSPPWQSGSFDTRHVRKMMGRGVRVGPIPLRVQILKMPVPRHCGTAAGAGQCPSCPFHWQAQPALNRGGALRLWLNLEQPQPEAAYGAHLPLAGRPSCATMSSLTCYRASRSRHFPGPFRAVCSLSGTLPEIFLGRSRFSFTSSGHLPPSRWSSEPAVPCHCGIMPQPRPGQWSATCHSVGVTVTGSALPHLHRDWASHFRSSLSSGREDLNVWSAVHERFTCAYQY